LRQSVGPLTAGLVRRLIGSGGWLPVLVDWTSCPSRDYMQLEAAVAMGGRALPVYHQVHRMSSYNNAHVQSRFVGRLAKHLGRETRVVVIADAGFPRSFFAAVERLGWHWVVRLGGPLKVRPAGSEGWRAVEALQLEANVKGRDLGDYELCRRRPYRARICVVSPPKRGRTGSSKHREHGHGTVEERCRRANSRPWVLATNLRKDDFGAADIIALYRQRMQIEQTFRDVKSHRFGMAMDYHRTRSCARQSVLRLLGTLALFVQSIVGLAVEQRGWARHFQVNTERRRRVLSWTTLARRVWRNGRYQLSDDALTASQREISKRIEYQPVAA
jgi:hypothetical protein